MILDSIHKLLDPHFLADTAQHIGEDDNSTAKALRGLSATILAGLLQKAGNSDSLEHLFQEITQFPETITEHLDALLVPGNLAHHDPKDTAGHLLGYLFGRQVPALTNGVASFSGTKPESVSFLLGVAGPLVFSLLRQRVQAASLNASGLANLLHSEQDRILAAVPSGLGAVLGLQPVAASATPAEPVAAKGMSWVWSLLLLLGPGVLVFFFLRHRAVASVELDLQPVGTAIDSSVQATQQAVRAAQAAQQVVKEISKAYQGVGGGVSGFNRKLPSGNQVLGNKDGIESQLIAFIEDGNRLVDKTTWFNFDRLLFALNSSDIELEKSRPQLNNMVDILKAYPKVQLRIGGYTDNTGVSSLNKKLSQARAEAVVKYLVGEGIDKSRLSAEGYGPEHPVASNDTEEGRAQNRRIAVRVTQK